MKCLVSLYLSSLMLIHGLMGRGLRDPLVHLHSMLGKSLEVLGPCLRHHRVRAWGLGGRHATKVGRPPDSRRSSFALLFYKLGRLLRKISFQEESDNPILLFYS